MNALETRQLNKAFGQLVVADNIDLQLPVGARHALIGPNGAGKTTLINLITGALSADSGSVQLNGNDITPLTCDRRVKLGLSRTFQINSLFPKLTPLESVTVAIFERDSISGGWLSSSSKQTKAIDEASELLSNVGLADELYKPTQDLAYGQQRLLEIALALAAKPSVLLLDEPAAGVPKDESAALFDVIATLPSQISILFIEHDMNLVFTFASHITVLVQGKVLVQGTAADIASNPLVREVYLGNARSE